MLVHMVRIKKNKGCVDLKQHYGVSPVPFASF